MEIDARGLPYRQLNDMVRDVAAQGADEILIKNVNGQRYIGTGVKGQVRITIEGVPGNDLAAFMDGPEIVVKGNAQDAVGNTMNSGLVTVLGNAGDVVGHSMRGGRIYIRGDVGYRVGIHMKEYADIFPVIIAGGKARDFLGEYMAGGMIVVLGLGAQEGSPLFGRYTGTGMHGGTIYVRGEVNPKQLGKEVGIREISGQDSEVLEGYLRDYCSKLNLSYNDIAGGQFTKLVPVSRRPYGRFYAY